MKKEYKLGDRVKTIQLGECTIVGIEYDSSSPYMYDVRVDGVLEEIECYTSDWKYSVNDAHSSLIEEGKKIHPVIIGRWMLVSDDEIGWKKRFVIKTDNRGYLVFSNTENEEELVYADDTTIYEFAKEIESEIEKK